MGRIKTFVNGGTLLPSDLNSIEDDYELADSTYRTLGTSTMEVTAAGGVGLYMFRNQVVNANVFTIAPTNNDPIHTAIFYLDPADFAAGSRTVKYRMRAQCYVGTATGKTYTVGLYPLSVTTGAFVMGTVVAGSTVAFTTPAANSANQGNSGDFTAPVAGHYAFGMNLVGSATPDVAIAAQLQMRQI